jgi:hypothetical protein
MVKSTLGEWERAEQERGEALFEKDRQSAVKSSLLPMARGDKRATDHPGADGGGR